MRLEDLEQNNLSIYLVEEKKYNLYIRICFMVHNYQILSYGKQGIL